MVMRLSDWTFALFSTDAVRRVEKIAGKSANKKLSKTTTTQPTALENAIELNKLLSVVTFIESNSTGLQQIVKFLVILSTSCVSELLNSCRKKSANSTACMLCVNLYNITPVTVWIKVCLRSCEELRHIREKFCTYKKMYEVFCAFRVRSKSHKIA